ncbi:hypothetical protein IAG25_39845 [Caballeronia sp. EK]|uniref:hypothetical protein n=1 Tax=Caballeronia sp. EK TaxID=2767469 RepID=UPI0016554043|nr:hypothetical protein [Caballeronia sp. EK]MBC8642930.1 hypothetical protein [Caballeronia sp. EK]
MRIFKSATQPVSTKPQHCELGRDVALVSGYAGWCEVTSADAIVGVTSLVNPDGGLASSDLMGTGFGSGCAAFGATEVGLVAVDFVALEMKGRKIAAEVKRLRSDEALHEEDVTSVELLRAEQEWRDFRVKNGSAIIIFLRDGVIQLLEVTNNVIALGKKCCLLFGYEVLKGVADATLKTIASVLSCVMGAFDVIAGAVELIRHRNETRISSSVAARLVSFISSEDQKVDLNQIASMADENDVTRQDRYIDVVSGIGSEKDTSDLKSELENVRSIYTDMVRIASSSRADIVGDKKKMNFFSYARIVYGVATMTIGILIVCGVATGVLPVVAAILGAVGLGCAVYRLIETIAEKRRSVKVENAEMSTLDSLNKDSLYEVEHQFCNDPKFRNSSKVAAAILLEHLSGGKREEKVSGVGKGKLALERIGQYCSGATARISSSADGLHMRRRTAVRFLLNLGLNRSQIRGIKDAIAKEQTGHAFVQLDGFIKGRFSVG